MERSPYRYDFGPSFHCWVDTRLIKGDGSTGMNAVNENPDPQLPKGIYTEGQVVFGGEARAT
jgi:hypothetical protein